MVSINLIPREILLVQARRTRTIRWAMTISISAILAAIPYSITLARAAHAEQARRQLDGLEDEATALRSQVRLAIATTEETRSELERSRALRGKRSWSGMLALIARCLPEECWILSMSTDPEAPSAAPSQTVPATTSIASAASTARERESVVVEAPQKLRLVGHSTSDGPPLVFVSRLIESRVFSRVALEKTQRAPGQSVAGEKAHYQFEIVCEW